MLAAPSVFLEVGSPMLIIVRIGDSGLFCGSGLRGGGFGSCALFLTARGLIGLSGRLVGCGRHLCVVGGHFGGGILFVAFVIAGRKCSNAEKKSDCQ